MQVPFKSTTISRSTAEDLIGKPTEENALASHLSYSKNKVAKTRSMNDLQTLLDSYRDDSKVKTSFIGGLFSKSLDKTTFEDVVPPPPILVPPMPQRHAETVKTVKDAVAKATSEPKKKEYMNEFKRKPSRRIMPLIPLFSLDLGRNKGEPQSDNLWELASILNDRSTLQNSIKNTNTQPRSSLHVRNSHVTPNTSLKPLKGDKKIDYRSSVSKKEFRNPRQIKTEKLKAKVSMLGMRSDDTNAKLSIVSHLGYRNIEYQNVSMETKSTQDLHLASKTSETLRNPTDDVPKIQSTENPRRRIIDKRRNKSRQLHTMSKRKKVLLSQKRNLNSIIKKDKMNFKNSVRTTSKENISPQQRRKLSTGIRPITKAQTNINRYSSNHKSADKHRKIFVQSQQRRQTSTGIRPYVRPKIGILDRLAFSRRNSPQMSVAAVGRAYPVLGPSRISQAFYRRGVSFLPTSRYRKKILRGMSFALPSRNDSKVQGNFLS